MSMIWLTQKDPCIEEFMYENFDARSTGLEPATSHVHEFHYFHSGMDYIFTIGLPLGAPVSSLYGAPLSKKLDRGSHGIRMFAFSKFSLHRYPREFQAAFRQQAAHLQAGALTKLSYDRIFI